MEKYPTTTRKGHPLATRRGTVRYHRLALYEKIGPGPHECHWCTIAVEWLDNLHADHLDFDTLNNEWVNLVPSCPGCNSTRFSVRDDRGARNPRGAKLNRDKVREIRESSESNYSLARTYGVSESVVKRVRLRQAWTWVA